MSKTRIPLDTRIASSEKYYIFSNRTKNSNWIDVLQEVESSTEFGIPEVLVLLDPKFYDTIRASDPRGKSSFHAAVSSARCRGNEVWGYPCPLTDSPIHVDHMFPRSKGGATHTQNAMYLCSEHNVTKHADIHFVLWENLPTQADWIRQSLESLINDAQHLTAEKLYLPKMQLLRL